MTGILIVFYDDLKHIPALARSLKAQSNREFTVYATDNDPSKKHCEEFRKVYPNFKEIASQGNVGFAVANNLLSRKAISDGCDRVMVLNPDMELHPDCIQNLLKVFQNHSAVGVTGPVLLYGNEQTSENRIQVYGIKANFRSQKKKILYNNSILDNSIPAQMEVDYVNGGSMMIRSEVIEAAGLFNEDYFMYNDEIDFAFRVRKKGFKTLTVKSAVAWHHHDWGKSNLDGHARMYYYVMRNKYLYFRQHRLFGNMLVQIAADVFLFPVKVRWASRIASAGMLKLYYRGCLDGIRGTKGKKDF